MVAARTGSRIEQRLQGHDPRRGQHRPARAPGHTSSLRLVPHRARRRIRDRGPRAGARDPSPARAAATGRRIGGTRHAHRIARNGRPRLRRAQGSVRRAAAEPRRQCLGLPTLSLKDRHHAETAPGRIDGRCASARRSQVKPARLPTALLATVSALMTGPLPASAAQVVNIAWNDAGDFERKLSVATGSFVELCGALERGQTVTWRFEASGALDFNIDFHEGKAIRTIRRAPNRHAMRAASSASSRHRTIADVVETRPPRRPR